MALVTVSTKRNRTYQRAFDHERAVAMRAEGMTYTAIAAQLGVSLTAVIRVCDPRTRQRMDEQYLEYARRQRVPCEGGCGTLVWARAGNKTGYCRPCFDFVRAAENVRSEELRCTNCREWKPDTEFHPDRQAREPGARRGRRSWCRSCENAARRKRRAKSRTVIEEKAA